MPDEEHHRYDQEDTTEEHAFDKLAKALASRGISRGRMLTMVGTAIVGGFLGTFALPGETEAKKGKGKSKGKGKGKKKKKCPKGAPLCGEFCCGVGDICCPPGPNEEGIFHCIPGDKVCCADGVNSCPATSPNCCSVQPQTKGQVGCCPDSAPVCIPNSQGGGCFGNV